MAERQLVVKIIGDSSSLERSFKRSEKGAKGFSTSMKGLASKTLFAGGAVAGVDLLTKGISGSIRAAKEAQVAQVNLRQALDASGISFVKQGKGIDAVIQKVSKLSGFDDEDLSNAFANLARTTGSAAKASRDIALAADIARARHISLAAATKLVEKAENGQLRGLKLVGVQIGKNTTATEAIQAAQKKFAGSAEGFGRTAAGAQARLGVAFENLQEKIGAGLLPVLTKLTLKLVDLIDWAEANFPKFQAAIQPIVKVVRVLFDNLAARIKNFIGIFKGVVEIIQGIAHGDWSKAWQGLKTVAVNALSLIFHTFLELPGKIASALGRAAFKGLSKIGGFIKDEILAGLKGLAGVIGDAARAIGKALTQGILDGIGNLGKALGDKLKGALGGAVKGAKGLLGIHSPSRVFEEIGKQIGAGLSQGITSSLKDARTALEAGLPTKLTAPKLDAMRSLGVTQGTPARRAALFAPTAAPPRFAFAGAAAGGRHDVHIHVELNRQEIAHAVELDITRLQQKRASRNPAQRRGPNRGI